MVALRRAFRWARGLRRRTMLGLSVGPTDVRAALLDRGVIQWAGQAPYDDLPGLAEVVARLAGEAGRPVRRARVVLERALVQLRSIQPAPPLAPSAARRYVALEATRLFRKNGAALVTDARIVAVDAKEKALWAAAASESLVRAVLEGCAQAGLEVEALGPAAEVLPFAVITAAGVQEIVFPNSHSSEVLSIGLDGTWRSRLVSGTTGAASDWAPTLLRLGPEAGHFASAYAATVARPHLELIPSETRAARVKVSRRRVVRLALLALACWALSGVIYVARLVSMARSSSQYLQAMTPAVDSAIALRRELDAGRRTLETVAIAEARRSRQLVLLGNLTATLGDSVFLVTLRVGPDGMVRFTGYAPSAARLLADVEKVRDLRDTKLESPATRETVEGRRTLDRFSVVASQVGTP